MFYEKQIREILRERYPDDDAIKKITLQEIRNVIKIFCYNIEKRLFNGFLVTIEKYFSLYYLRSYKIGKIKKHEDEISVHH